LAKKKGKRKEHEREGASFVDAKKSKEKNEGKRKKEKIK